MTAWSDRPYNQPILTGLDGLDTSIPFTLAINAVAYVWAGSAVTTTITDDRGVLQAVPAFTWTAGASGAGTLSLTAAQKVSLGVGNYHYTFTIAIGAALQFAMAGQFSIALGQTAGTTTAGIGVTSTNGVITANVTTAGMTVAQGEAIFRPAPQSHYGSSPLASDIDVAAYTAPNAAANLAIVNYVGGTNEVVEPSVYFNPNTWNGYEYWMAAGPYDNTNNAFENPSIWASHDGQTWIVPGTNPVQGPPTQGNYDDPHLMEYGGILYLTWNWNKHGFGLGDQVLMSQSSNGTTWSAPVALVTASSIAGYDLNSPHMEYHNGLWYLWTANTLTGTVAIELRTCTTVTGTWSAPTICTAPLPAASAHGEFEVRRVGAQWWMLANVTDPGSAANGRLYLRTSYDGITWTLPPTPLLTAGVTGAWDGNYIYKSGFVPLIDGRIQIWYNGASSGPLRWKIGYTIATPVANPAPTTASLWYAPRGAVTATSQLSQAGIGFIPVYFPRQVTLTNIGLEITGAGASGSVVRLGVASDLGGKPYKVLLDAGTIDGTSATFQSKAAAVTVGPGWVWFMAAGQGAPVSQPTARTMTGGAGLAIGTTSALASVNSLTGYFWSAGAAGAFPATITQASLTAVNAPWKVIYQL